MHVRVLLFGSVREALGVKDLEVELDAGATVGDLRARLADRHALFARHRLLSAVNQETVPETAVLADGDEVAFLPPVSGGAPEPEAGSGRCTLHEEPLDVHAVEARVTGDDAGGVVTFVGAVRNRSKGQDIRHLEYEAYPGMAEREMEKICDEAARRWPDSRVAIAHRVGQLAIGDLAVVVSAAAPHRAEAFEACRFAIDTLKETVPIWKKEFTTEGESWVEDHP
ncbi:MAG TPA: molybdopterin converting factor subunit 1 [Myxococcota bacterium]|nr:molybdopterin converting factor subunit 1 [Myxococcota bacterium]